jgi:hypothetical protein
MPIENYYDACTCGFSGRVPSEKIYTERSEETGEDLVFWDCAECDATNDTGYALSEEFMEYTIS